jgi:hypothetical protein
VVESVEAVGQLVARGEDQHRHPLARIALLSDQFQAVAVGQAAIDHEAVVAVHGQLQIRIGHIARQIDREAGGPQSGDDLLA